MEQAPADGTLAGLTLARLQVRTLGECRYDSDLAGYLATRQTNEHYVDEDDRVLVDDTTSLLRARGLPVDRAPSFEAGGPRRKLYFRPGRTRVGIVTCGGLCPGLNDVIRGLVRELANHYDIPEAVGFRFGYAGLVPGGPEPVRLTKASVEQISEHGGTVLGTSRGAQDPAVMVDRLLELGIDVLFVIGGDGSMRGALAIAQEAVRRGVPLSVVGVPKTIDNDIPYIGHSFGFQTAFTEAAVAIGAARTEAQAAVNGIGLVRLMGRHSGFITCYAALANHNADVVLIPEVPFRLEGDDGLLATLQRRLADRGNAVVVVAEGAGQDLVTDGTGAGSDASGNTRLRDVGRFLQAAITEHFAGLGTDITLKYLEPGYQIRSVKAKAWDAVYCVRLAQTAVHAAMAGRTAMVVGRLHNRFIHVPIEVVVSRRNVVAADGDLWLSVLESTGQRLGGGV